MYQEHKRTLCLHEIQGAHFACDVHRQAADSRINQWEINVKHISNTALAYILPLFAPYPYLQKDQTISQ